MRMRRILSETVPWASEKIGAAGVELGLGSSIVLAMRQDFDDEDAGRWTRTTDDDGDWP